MISREIRELLVSPSTFIQKPIEKEPGVTHFSKSVQLGERVLGNINNAINGVLKGSLEGQVKIPVEVLGLGENTQTKSLKIDFNDYGSVQFLSNSKAILEYLLSDRFAMGRIVPFLEFLGSDADE